jgi:hypothetical protein
MWEDWEGVRGKGRAESGGEGDNSNRTQNATPPPTKTGRRETECKEVL